MAGMVFAALLACEEQANKVKKPDPAVSGPLEEVGRRLKAAGEPRGPKASGDEQAADASEKEKPTEEGKPVVPVAKAVAGKPGFVFSPHSGKQVDVREFKVGDLVVDPDFANGEKKYFRVPDPIIEPEVSEESAVELPQEPVAEPEGTTDS